ncbi:hypothetical protein NEOLEDRAFT_1145164 [Neolentinus lepideus HHB14362 ss-1]|uniref:Uncharacterized protein n=1 Tax=Neolentinus lepideus HHB14362 ss-1 TaxID=1314782 RepID=A0A165VAZ4_9AGAM|nr:hypothetical protein NEOLEDRAFT_1145164 [Neolentinus lepideus HHB14362 ss-1]
MIISGLVFELHVEFTTFAIVTVTMIVEPNKTPTSPPPPYTVEPTALPPASSSQTQAAFGPTPLAQQQETLLPYYDPRSPYSVEQAEVRARKRFVGAVVWAFALMFVAGMVTGAGVGARRR